MYQCRICLGLVSENLNIFDSKFKSTLNRFENLIGCTLKPIECLSKSICQKCVDEVKYVVDVVRDWGNIQRDLIFDVMQLEKMMDVNNESVETKNDNNAVPLPSFQNVLNTVSAQKPSFHFLNILNNPEMTMQSQKIREQKPHTVTRIGQMGAMHTMASRPFLAAPPQQQKNNWLDIDSNVSESIISQLLNDPNDEVAASTAVSFLESVLTENKETNAGNAVFEEQSAAAITPYMPNLNPNYTNVDQVPFLFSEPNMKRSWNIMQNEQPIIATPTPMSINKENCPPLHILNIPSAAIVKIDRKTNTNANSNIVKNKQMNKKPKMSSTVHWKVSPMANHQVKHTQSTYLINNSAVCPNNPTANGVKYVNAVLKTSNIVRVETQKYDKI